MLEEWKVILKKPMIWLTMLGLAVIPALYNIIFLSSMWDPYGKIDHLPVAVVNQDRAVQYQEKTLAIGKDMVDNMSKIKELDYHFVSSSKAQKGLEEGEYFMVVTLPKDLSQNAASLLTDQPEKMTISYQTSKGHSFVASKMAESAMSLLKENVAENITYTYTSALFQNITRLSTGLGEAGDGSKQLEEGSKTLEDGSQILSRNLDKLSHSSLAFSDGAETLFLGLGQYTAGVSQLASGSASLTSGISRYTEGVDRLANGANLLDEQSAHLLEGVNQLSTSSNQLQPLIDGTNQLSQGLTELSSKVSLSEEQSAQIDQLSQGLV